MSSSEIENTLPEDAAAEQAARLTRTFRDFPVHVPQRRKAINVSSRQLNMALGWLSVGVGLAELLAPRTLNEGTGVRQRPIVTRLCGLRQIANGIGLLSERAPISYGWARVAGDALDLALLGTAMRKRGVRPVRAAFAATLFGGMTALDIFAAQQSRREASERAREPRSVRCHININVSPDKLFAFWRDLENLPRFISHLRVVQSIGKRKTHWIVDSPAKLPIEWDIEIVDEQPGRLLAWRTLPGSSVNHHGVIAFAPLAEGRGTQISVALEYSTPSGTIGTALTRLLGGNPAAQINQDLRRLKALIENPDVAAGATGKPAREFFAALRR